MPSEKGSDLEHFAALVVEEMHAMEERLGVRIDGLDRRVGGLEGDVASIKLDIVEIKEELRGIRHELREIDRRLDTLEERIGWMAGYSKEIDELRARVKSMEAFMRTQGYASA